MNKQPLLNHERLVMGGQETLFCWVLCSLANNGGYMVVSFISVVTTYQLTTYLVDQVTRKARPQQSATQKLDG